MPTQPIVFNEGSIAHIQMIITALNTVPPSDGKNASLITLAEDAYRLGVQLMVAGAQHLSDEQCAIIEMGIDSVENKHLGWGDF